MNGTGIQVRIQEDRKKVYYHNTSTVRAGFINRRAVEPFECCENLYGCRQNIPLMSLSTN